MKIAMPLVAGNLSAHFGHCESFLLVDVDPDSRQIIRREDHPSPPHQPGMLPRWLAERGATVILAGGMGQRAMNLFEAEGIQVVVGVNGSSPDQIVDDFLNDRLEAGGNVCDH